MSTYPQKKIIIIHKETKVEIEIPSDSVVEVVEFSQSENSNPLSSREETHSQKEAQSQDKNTQKRILIPVRKLNPVVKLSSQKDENLEAIEKWESQFERDFLSKYWVPVLKKALLIDDLRTRRILYEELVIQDLEATKSSIQDLFYGLKKYPSSVVVRNAIRAYFRNAVRFHNNTFGIKKVSHTDKKVDENWLKIAKETNKEQ